MLYICTCRLQYNYHALTILDHIAIYGIIAQASLAYVVYSILYSTLVAIEIGSN